MSRMQGPAHAMRLGFTRSSLVTTQMIRRQFIKNTALVIGAMACKPESMSAQANPAAIAGDAPVPRSKMAELIDTHVYLSRWPYRRLTGDETPQLAGKLSEMGVISAWAGSFDALLHQDMAGVNIRLAEECARETTIRLEPFGAINPTLPDWEEDLRRCHEVHRMPGIRLHPDFHGYTLDDPRFRRLVELATQRRLVIQIGLGMEDSRLSSAMRPPTDPSPLVDHLPKFPEARVVLLNFWLTFSANRMLVLRLHSLPQVSFDMATVENVAGIETILAETNSLRMLFGSYAPFYNFGSSVRKLRESILTPEQLAAIRYGYAAKILKPA